MMKHLDHFYKCIRERWEEETKCTPSASSDKRRNAIFGKEDMNFLYQDFAQGGVRRTDTIIHPTTVCLNHAKKNRSYSKYCHYPKLRGGPLARPEVQYCYPSF